MPNNKQREQQEKLEQYKQNNNYINSWVTFDYQHTFNIDHLVAEENEKMARFFSTASKEQIQLLIKKVIEEFEYEKVPGRSIIDSEKEGIDALHDNLIKCANRRHVSRKLLNEFKNSYQSLKETFDPSWQEQAQKRYAENKFVSFTEIEAKKEGLASTFRQRCGIYKQFERNYYRLVDYNSNLPEVEYRDTGGVEQNGYGQSRYVEHVDAFYKGTKQLAKNFEAKTREENEASAGKDNNEAYLIQLAKEVVKLHKDLSKARGGVAYQFMKAIKAGEVETGAFEVLYKKITSIPEKNRNCIQSLLKATS